MKTRIIMKGVRFYAYHGALPQERTVGTTYVLTLEVCTPFRKAIQSDSLTGTIDYSLIYDSIQQEMQNPSFLLEHLAGRIARRLFNDFPAIDFVRVVLLKEHPPVPNCQCAGMGVELEVSRAEMEYNFQ